MKSTICTSIILVMAFSGIAMAQIGYGEISGFVYDEQGAVVPAVDIVITSPALLGERVVKSGPTGRYRVINLPPGIYMIDAAKQGYSKKNISNIEVRAGKASSYNLTMLVGEFETTITIFHETPIIDLKNPQRAVNVDGEFVRRLPVSPTSEWLGFLSLIPGTNFGGSLRFNSNHDCSFAFINGAGQRANVFAIDGMMMNMSPDNLSNSDISLEIVEDVQVITSGFHSGLSTSLGGYFNVVTKSGGNDIRGSTLLKIQPQAWNWTNIESGEAAKQEQYTGDFSIGGPVFKDKLWYFANIHYLHYKDEYGFSELQLGAFDYYDWPRPTEPFRERDQYRIFGKLSYSLNDSHKLVAQLVYEKDDDISRNQGSSTVYTDSAGILHRDSSYVPTFTLESIWSDRFNTRLTATFVDYFYGGTSLQEGQTGKIYRYDIFTPSTTGGRPSLSRGYAVQVIAGNGSYTYTGDSESLQIRGDANWFIEDFAGNHDIDFGFDITPYHIFDRRDPSTTTGYNYRIEVPNASGDWVAYMERDYIPGDYFTTGDDKQKKAVFFQDEWTYNDRLTLSLGLRIEGMSDSLGDMDTIGYSPNIGFNYALTGDQKTSLRFSFGRREAPYNGSIRRKASAAGASYIVRYDYDLDGIWDEVKEGGGTASIPTEPGMQELNEYTLKSMDPNMHSPYAWQFQAGITRVLPWNLTVDAMLKYHISKDSINYYNTNLIFEEGEFVGFARGDILYNNVYMNNIWSSNHYRGAEISLSKTFSNNWQMIASYTWSRNKTKGDWSPYEAEYYFYPESWFEMVDLGDNHMIKFAVSVVLPYDVTAAVNYNWYSGDDLGHKEVYYRTTSLWSGEPYVSNASGQEMRHPFYDMTLITPRSANVGFGDPLSSLNISFGKDFSITSRYRINASMEIFNVFNNGGYTYPNTYPTDVLSDGSYKYPDLVDSYPGYYPQSPRMIMLRTRFTF